MDESCILHFNLLKHFCSPECKSHRLNNIMIFSLEGNIGAGKSTLLKRIDEALTGACIDHVVLYEPVDQWMNTKIKGRGMLELFYEDKAKYGFTFQMFVLQTRVQQMLDCLAQHPGKVIVTERCHITDCEIFAKMMEKSDLLTPSEVLVYSKWYETCSYILHDYLKGIIYLKASSAVCVERIMKRSRPGEERISLEYIGKVNDAHDSWILSPDQTLPTVVIDANQDEHLVDIGSILKFVQNVYLS